MTRGEITKALSHGVENFIDPNRDARIYWAKEVTFDYSTNHSVRVDYMRFKPVNNTVGGIEHGDVYCYEIKSSVEDFQSKHGHNFIGDYNYYVMPKDVYAAVYRQIPANVGVYVAERISDGLKLEKKARRKARERPVSEILLMMFRSAARERRR